VQSFEPGHSPASSIDCRCVKLRKGNIVTASRQVEIGQRFRTVRVAGGPLPTVWEVVNIYRPWQNGIEHACLKSVDGSAGTMTLATSVIADKKRFARGN
jgi:hypothetical protein